MEPRILTGCTAIGALAALAAATSSCSAGGGGPGGPDSRLPNVLVIVTDDARSETLTAMPETRRWFQAEGVTYANAFAASPSCGPSRASILSGRYPHNSGVLTQDAGDRLDQRSTMQRYLQERGYFTAMSGKFLNRWALDQPPPYFDRFAIAHGGYADQIWSLDGARRRLSGYSTTVIADRALEYLAAFEQRSDSRPWFLYLATFAPHKPRTPEPRYAHREFGRWSHAAVNEATDDKPQFLASRQELPDAEIQRVRTEQLRTLISVDDLVDRVFTALAATGELDRTLAFFLSDNGYLWGEHRWLGKYVPYDGSIHVPLLVRWPGRLPAGSVVQDLVSTLDIVPTVLEAAGISPDPAYPLDGRSLLQPASRKEILVEYAWDPRNSPAVPAWAALRGADFQYVERQARRSRRSGVLGEYYDLRRDPAMLQNLLADDDSANDAVATRPRQLLATARRCVGPACP